MTNLETIKISGLPPSGSVLKNDLLVVDRQRTGGNYVTNAVTILTVAEQIAKLDLNFTGNVTFINTIQPPLSGTLDAIFDNVEIRQSLTLGDGVTISGLHLNDLEDVTIDNPKEDDVLVYKFNPATGEEEFINERGVLEAPMDGRIYARSNGGWVDITDNLMYETLDIGDVIIIKTDDFPLEQGVVHTFTATTPTVNPSLTDIVYQWTANRADAVISSPTSKQTNITFNDSGSFIITVTASSLSASDSPRGDVKNINISYVETFWITQENNYLILTEEKEPIRYNSQY